MKKEYENIGEALKDLSKTTNNANEKFITKVTTNEFVRLNNKRVPYQTGTLRKSIVANTDYEKGLVTARTPYAVKTYFHNVTGVVKYFEVTSTINKTLIANVVKKITEEVIDKI